MRNRNVSRRRARIGTAIALSAVAASAAGTLASDAGAAFPGADGLIAFEHESIAGDHTQADLATIAAGGGPVAMLTDTPARNEFGPAWSADGERIAFWRTRAPFGPGSIWVIDSGGGDPRRLTSAIDARDPAWNPAGTRIAFSGPGRAANETDILIMRASDGTLVRRLTAGAKLDFEPAWSPSGAELAFTRGSSQGADAGDLFVATLGDGRVRRLTHGSGYDHQASWSPSGARIAFERDQIQTAALHTIRRNGSARRRLTRGQHFDSGPAFAPSGTAIAFGSDRGSLLSDLWLVGPDGSGRTRLTDFPASSDGFGDWQPLP